MHDAECLALVFDVRTGLKALYAECNAFDRISGLSQCRNLRSLFLQDICVKLVGLIFHLALRDALGVSCQ